MKSRIIALIGLTLLCCAGIRVAIGFPYPESTASLTVGTNVFLYNQFDWDWNQSDAQKVTVVFSEAVTNEVVRLRMKHKKRGTANVEIRGWTVTGTSTATVTFAASNIPNAGVYWGEFIMAKTSATPVLYKVLGRGVINVHVGMFADTNAATVVVP